MQQVPFFYSIRFKFIIFVSAFIVLIMALVNSVFFVRERGMIEERIKGEAFLLLDTFLDTAKEAILTNDTQALNIIINKITKEKNFSYIQIYPADTKQCLVHWTNSKKEQNIGKKNKEEVDRILRMYKPFSQRIDYKGNIYIEVSKTIKENNKAYALVSFGMSLENMGRELRMTTYYVLIIGMAAIIIGLIVAVFLANITLNPLEKLLSIVKLMSIGEFSQKVSVKTKDEFGLLSTTFNKMSTNIATLYHVTSAMSFMNDTEHLLSLILNKALLALKSDHGSLMLLDEDGKYLQVRVVCGLKNEPKSFVRIPVGEGVAGIVAQTGNPMIINSGFHDDRFKIFRPDPSDEKSIKSLLCVPLKSDEKIFGVINIVNKANAVFEKDDCQFLSVLASQAAMSLAKAKLYEDSITDGLTKLYIHRYFQSRLLEEIKRALRYNSNVSLLMIDLDHFKNLNDTYGHQQGDIVLATTSAIIKESIRENLDISCRYGGEELSVIMPETDITGAKILAERLRIKIESQIYSVNNNNLSITVSMGIATFPSDLIKKDDPDDKSEILNKTDAEKKDALIKKADEALYLAKACGRNRVILASELPF